MSLTLSDLNYNNISDGKNVKMLFSIIHTKHESVKYSNIKSKTVQF